MGNSAIEVKRIDETYGAELTNIDQLRLQKYNEIDESNCKHAKYTLVQIAPFSFLAAEDSQQQLQEDILENKSDEHEEFQTGDGSVCTRCYFDSHEHLQSYLSNLMNLKQLASIQIYDAVQIYPEAEPCYLETTIIVKGRCCNLTTLELRESPGKLIDLLCFVAQHLCQATRLLIHPSEIFRCQGRFYIKKIHYSRYSRLQILLGYIGWAFELEPEFEECITNENLLSSLGEAGVYVSDVVTTLKSGKVSDGDIVVYLQRVRERMQYLENSIDSLHACQLYRKTKMLQRRSEWLVGKRNNEAYFYNVPDEHYNVTKIIRKKKKFSLEQLNVLFDEEELDIKFVAANTKMLVSVGQFRLGQHSSISGIELRYKLPFKLKNPRLFLGQNRQIFMLEQMVYRYSIEDNKLSQQSKRINDHIFLAQSHEHGFLVVRMSIDIFLNGIRVYFANKYESIFPMSSPLLSDLQSLRVDISQVQFCIQIYKGVYLMLANYNLWILDVNLLCFFTFAPIEKIKTFCRSKQAAPRKHMFDILSQPFEATFLSNHDGINAMVSYGKLHILGLVNQRIYYLEYGLLFESGMLRLLKYQPLFTSGQTIKTTFMKAAALRRSSSQHAFNLYNQNLQMYKNSLWIYTGPMLLQVYTFKLSGSKNCWQMLIESEQCLLSLRECIQNQRKLGTKWQKVYVTMLLRKITAIFDYLQRNQISHKNISIGSLFITSSKDIKLIGWSEPQKAWHISDFKDYLLLSLNVITLSCYEKLNDKLLLKHQDDLKDYPIYYEKLAETFKAAKQVEKKPEIDKNIALFKQFLNRDLLNRMSSLSGNFDDIIFSFEFNTPRFSLLRISLQKLKKLTARIEITGTASEEFIFHQSDKFAWNEADLTLYIFTTQYRMYEVKINLNEFKEETVVLEECEYLQQNIVDSSFVYVPGYGLLSFGGTLKGPQNTIAFNLDIYKYNKEKLTWVAVSSLSSPLVDPKLTISSCKRYVYLFAGDCDEGSPLFKMQVYDVEDNKVNILVDKAMKTPFLNDEAYFIRVFELSDNVFLVWHVSSSSFFLKVFSLMICGYEIDLEGKTYIDECTNLKDVSVSFVDNTIHFLRPYGRYTAIKIDKLETTNCTNKTLYN